MKKLLGAIGLAMPLLFVGTSVSAQVHPSFDSVRTAIVTQNTLKPGDPINISISYRVDTPRKVEDALVYLNDYGLIIDGIAYPNNKLQNMTLLKNQLLSDSLKYKTYAVTYQTKLPTTYKNDSVSLGLSDFWYRHFKPGKDEQNLTLSLVNAKPAADAMSGTQGIVVKMYNWGRFVTFIIFFLVLLTLVVILASKDHFILLRDDTGCTSPLNNTFSLSRVQVFIWTFVIFSLVAYLWSVSDIFPEIKPSHLILLGIAFGQKILAQLIDKRSPPAKAAAPPAPPVVPPVPPVPPVSSCSRGFFTDLISDSTGLSMTRLQFLIATFIFMVVFITTAIQKLQLVDFSIEQLGLMGTSAGLYLWNKRLDQ